MTTATYAPSPASSASIDSLVADAIDRITQALSGLSTERGPVQSRALPTIPTRTADDQTRFFGELLSIVVPAATQLVPNILNALQSQNRDLPRFRGTRDPQAVEQDFATVLGALLPQLIERLPGLIDQLSNRRAPTGGDPAARFFPLLATLIPAAVSAIPSIVQAFTGGGRDVPLSDSPADPETSQRFFGPILEAVLPMASQIAPQIFSLFGRP